MDRLATPMAGDIPKVNVAARDRILLHLFANLEWADRYLVPAAMTRPGIAEACAQHPPNVSRTMRQLLKEELVEEHTRACLLYTSPSPRDRTRSRMPSSA